MMGLGDTIFRGYSLSFHRYGKIDSKSPVKFNFVQVFSRFATSMPIRAQKYSQLMLQH